MAWGDLMKIFSYLRIFWRLLSRSSRCNRHHSSEILFHKFSQQCSFAGPPKRQWSVRSCGEKASQLWLAHFPCLKQHLKWNVCMSHRKKFSIFEFSIDKLSYLIAIFIHPFLKSDYFDNTIPVCSKSTHWHSRLL